MRVLIIDDEPDVILLCRVNLEFEGHEVLEAASGEEGLEIAEKELPDLIVLDLMLPRQDGFSVLRHLHSHEPTKHIPVVLLTAKSREDDQMRGWQTGADEYVTKPFSPVALTEAVARVAGMTAEEREARRRERLEQLSLLHRL
ncbi:MAG TPA: response regulator [Actinomycetota bacterium]